MLISPFALGLRRAGAIVALAALALLPVACGGTKHAATATTAKQLATTTAASTHATTTALASTGPGGLQAEAAATATGDIPDNQTFLTYRNTRAGYSLSYPEGWAQSGGGPSVTIRDKNNIIRIVAAHGGLPAGRAATHGLQRVTHAPVRTTVHGAPAVKVVYASESAPNSVTGKKVTLAVDRYYFTHGGKLAILDLGTPQGVDNVDAYRLIADSFRWR